MVRSGTTTALLAAGIILALGALRPPPALALSTETYSLDSNSTANLANPDPKVYQLYKNNNDTLTDNDSGNSGDGGPRNLTFGSPDSGFSFSVGRTDNSSPYDPFNNRQRFFGPDPFMPPR